MNPDASSDQTLNERISIARVVQFFLRLYALQSGAPAGAPTRYTLVNSTLPDTENIYDLSVKIGNKFRSRRLAIAQIGTRSRSKSLCYKVVFDVPIVVKIPAVPIRTFKTYIKSLQGQHLIVDEYDADKRIIAPGVTVFFKIAQVIDEFFTKSAARLEGWGVRWLEAHPEYHRYLKIDDGFVFLMDLSTHTFLSSVLHKIHDVRAEIPEEILRHPNVLWNFSGFECRYGSEHAKVCFWMNSVWNEYEKGVRQITQQAGMRPWTVYEQRQWLLTRLAGLPSIYPGDAPPEFVAPLERMTAQLLEKSRKPIAAYHRTVQAYIKRTAFTKNETKIRGLVVSLLDLLAWLDQSRLAIRDLKPDNLFIAGDTERHSYLTADPEKYYLGLIDIETAIGLSNAPDSQAQPLLGGTPSYATISQFYPNSILVQTYPDLTLILHLQDWYAVMAMAYEAVTGRHLFSRTRRLLFDIKALSRKLQTQTGNPLEAYSGSNYIFWRKASEEFELGIRANRNRLRAILVEPTDTARDLLARHAKQQLSLVSRTMADTLSKLSGMVAIKQHRQLLTASYREVVALRQHLEKLTRLSPQPPQKQERLLGLVRLLEGRKWASEALGNGISALEAPTGKIPTDGLLKLMFHTVACAMETPRPTWGRGNRKRPRATPLSAPTS